MITLYSVGEPASAAIVNYRLGGVGSGSYTNGADITPFSDVEFEIDLTVDTSLVAENPDVASGYEITSASISEQGHSGNFGDFASGDDYVFFLKGTPAGTIFFGGLPPYAPDNGPPAFYGAGLAGYDGVSDLGPISVTYSDALGTVDPTFADGADQNFTSISDAILGVSAAPEPASWALMMAGLAAAGMTLRNRRRIPAAIMA